MTFTRSALVRLLASCTLLFSAIGVTTSGHTEAAAKTKAYASSQYHFKLSYPTTWTLEAAASTADAMGAAEAKVNPKCLLLIAPDQRGIFNVLVQSKGSTVAQMKASLTVFMNEGAKLVGAIKYSTGTQSGMHLVAAMATDKVDAKHNAQGTLVAGSNGHFTWYTGMAYVEGYPATKQNTADLEAIMSSFSPT
jgi:hypothetical protein